MPFSVESFPRPEAAIVAGEALVLIGLKGAGNPRRVLGPLAEGGITLNAGFREIREYLDSIGNRCATANFGFDVTGSFGIKQFTQELMAFQLNGDILGAAQPSLELDVQVESNANGEIRGNRICATPPACPDSYAMRIVTGIICQGKCICFDFYDVNLTPELALNLGTANAAEQNIAFSSNLSSTDFAGNPIVRNGTNIATNLCICFVDEADVLPFSLT